jgi:dUTP pyrophosphatase
MIIKIKKLVPEATLPQIAKVGDAAMDLVACRDYSLAKGEKVLISTGIAMAIPAGFWGNIRDRSGLAAKHGLHTIAGVIDPNYRGEILVAMVNLGSEDYQIKAGDRIAQMLIQKFEDIEIEESSELEETNRGEKGFGSSGY